MQKPLARPIGFSTSGAVRYVYIAPQTSFSSPYDGRIDQFERRDHKAKM